MVNKSGPINIRKDLEASALDGAITVTRTLAGAFPLVGSPLAELVTAIMGSPLSRRRDKWLISTAEGLDELREKVSGFRLDELSENEQFVTATLQAAQIALRNHQKVKLDALRNAVLNAALPSDLSDDQQLMFLEWVDALTASHVRVVSFSRNPQVWMAANGVFSGPTGRNGFIDPNLVRSRLLDNPDMYSQVIRDLVARGLLDEDPLVRINNTNAPERLTLPYLTKLGREFLTFITAPPCLNQTM